MDIYETFMAVKERKTLYPYCILESEKISIKHKTINLELDEVAKVYKLEKKQYFDCKTRDLKHINNKKIIVVYF